MDTPYDICFVTVGDAAAAEKITSGLIGERLAACVTAVPGVRSSYRWEDRVETSEEILLVVKTRRALREEVVRFVKRNHPYAVPEIIFTGIDSGSPDYLDWLGACTARPDGAGGGKSYRGEEMTL